MLDALIILAMSLFLGLVVHGITCCKDKGDERDDKSE